MDMLVGLDDLIDLVRRPFFLPLKLPEISPYLTAPHNSSLSFFPSFFQSKCRPLLLPILFQHSFQGTNASALMKYPKGRVEGWCIIYLADGLRKSSSLAREASGEAPAVLIMSEDANLESSQSGMMPP